MTEEELITRLRNQLEFYNSGGRFTAADRIEELVAELDLMKTAGIIEIASRNNRVTEYMFHWEGRALDAEAKLAKAVEALKLASSGRLTEINPNNYNHDDVCEQYDASVEVVLSIAAVLAELGENT